MEVKDMGELTSGEAVFRMSCYAIGIFIIVPLLLRLFNNKRK